MCGRFTLKATTQQLSESFVGVEIPDELPPRYNIAPSQPIAAILNQMADQVDFVHWGLIPSWAKDAKIGYKMINARGETLAEKPSFKAAFKRRRCLILCDGFYEWQVTPGTKQKTPMYITLADGNPFAFAGLWEQWQSPDGSLIKSATIITTSPNDFMAPIHNRMPVILPQDRYEAWLDPNEQPPAALNPLLQAYPPELMTAHPVSTLVNNPRNDEAECIMPVS